ncbi:hypothetical protein LTR37_011747 [Vermiconidia calcicola]|uniref:Uncharacterized protein n=1 Tax=Vermiconidia calcicola TaxID=1690605 RepID=A0ACC3N1T7_9PEZI|nr:hypothetical protein LTR37_011747 [Vermiconidia calcicola]
MDQFGPSQYFYLVQDLREDGCASALAIDVHEVAQPIGLDAYDFDVDKVVGWRVRSSKDESDYDWEEFKVRWSPWVVTKIDFPSFTSATIEGKPIFHDIRGVKVDDDTITVYWKDQWLASELLKCADGIQKFWIEVVQARLDSLISFHTIESGVAMHMGASGLWRSQMGALTTDEQGVECEVTGLEVYDPEPM